MGRSVLPHEHRGQHEFRIVQIRADVPTIARPGAPLLNNTKRVVNSQVPARQTIPFPDVRREDSPSWRERGRRSDLPR
jgi:hypothetical protein